MKSKRVIIVAALAIVVSTLAVSVFASNTLRFEQLVEKTLGYKDRAKASGISDIKDIKIAKDSNKGNKNLKDISKMSGYVKDEDLKDVAKYEAKELLTYEEFLNKYSEFDYDPTISKDRMVWVTTIHYPNGFQHKKGFVNNAIEVQYYDAETGESLGCSIKSLDKDGLGIKK